MDSLTFYKTAWTVTQLTFHIYIQSTLQILRQNLSFTNFFNFDCSKLDLTLGSNNSKCSKKDHLQRNNMGPSKMKMEKGKDRKIGERGEEWEQMWLKKKTKLSVRNYSNKSTTERCFLEVEFVFSVCLLKLQILSSSALCFLL